MRAMIDRVRAWEKAFHASFTGEIVTEADRRRARAYVKWIDHGILRALWHNLHEVAPGVWRSNHPDHARLAQHAAAGIGTILTLRGAQTKAFHRLEEESCAALGLELRVIGMASREAPGRAALLDLLDFFDRRAAAVPDPLQVGRGPDVACRRALPHPCAGRLRRRGAGADVAALPAFPLDEDRRTRRGARRLRGAAAAGARVLAGLDRGRLRRRGGGAGLPQAASANPGTGISSGTGPVRIARAPGPRSARKAGSVQRRPPV
jgi:hypothetical protein